VDTNLEGGALLPQVLDLDVELLPLVLEDAIQPDDHPWLLRVSQQLLAL
jgi:hypothetical protein